MSRTGSRPLSLEQLHQRTDVRFYVDSAVHRRDASTKLDKFFDNIQSYGSLVYNSHAAEVIFVDPASSPCGDYNKHSAHLVNYSYVKANKKATDQGRPRLEFRFFMIPRDVPKTGGSPEVIDVDTMEIVTGEEQYENMAGEEARGDGNEYREDVRHEKAHCRGTVRPARHSISSSTIQPARPRRSSRLPADKKSPTTGQAFPLPTFLFSSNSLDHPKVWSWILKLANHIVGMNADMTIEANRLYITRAVAIFWEDGPPSDHLKNLLLSREDLNTQFIEAMDQGRKAADNLNSIALSGAEIIQAIEAAYATWSTDSARLPFIANSAHVSASELELCARLPPNFPPPPAMIKIGYHYTPEFFKWLYELYEVMLTDDYNTSAPQFAAMVSLATDGKVPRGSITSYHSSAKQLHREIFSAIRRKVARKLGRCDHSDSETEEVPPSGSAHAKRPVSALLLTPEPDRPAKRQKTQVPSGLQEQKMRNESKVLSRPSVTCHTASSFGMFLQAARKPSVGTPSRTKGTRR